MAGTFTIVWRMTAGFTAGTRLRPAGGPRLAYSLGMIARPGWRPQWN
jgi:hypothetical protein